MARDSKPFESLASIMAHGPCLTGPHRTVHRLDALQKEHRWGCSDTEAVRWHGLCIEGYTVVIAKGSEARKRFLSSVALAFNKPTLESRPGAGLEPQAPHSNRGTTA